MVISGGAKEKANRWQVRVQERPAVKSPDGEFVVLILACRKSEIHVNVGRIALQPKSDQKLLLRFGEFLLQQQSLAQPPMQLGVIGMSLDPGAICSLGKTIFLGTRVKVGQVALRFGVARSEFHCSLKFRDGVIFLVQRGQNAPQLKMNRRIFGALAGKSPQERLSIA